MSTSLDDSIFYLVISPQPLHKEYTNLSVMTKLQGNENVSRILCLSLSNPENLTNCSISKNNNDLVADLNLNILKKATKYQKNMIEKRRKDNPYIMGDMEHGGSREKPKKTD